MSEVIKGKIVSYIYKSEESLYKVAKILTTDNDEVIIVGSFIELEEGLDYEFVGNYVDHAKYGVQFKIESYTKSASFSKDGLIAYLSSDKFYGIGPKLAENIVAELGTDCINLIMENGDVLDRVRHMTASKKKVIIETLKENYAAEQVFIKLFSFGLTSKMIYRLYEVYGNEAASRIEENPYCLIYDVDGFGFKRSDDLALTLGFKENDKLRLREAIKYTLNMVCYQQGYSFLTCKQLINSSYNLLKNSPLIQITDLEKALATLVEKKLIIQEDDRYFEPTLFNAEIKCAERIRKLKEKKISFFNLAKIQESIKQVEEDLNISYTDLQKEAITLALSNKLAIITGGPGTGKSTIINGIIRCYALLNNINYPSDELEYRLLLMAPTGRASKRMVEVCHFKASTIHKALGYNYENGFSVNEDFPLNCSLAIIDESSMIDINLAAALFKALPLSCQVILVGDENQLPSVSPGNVFHDLIASNLFTTIRLYQIMRQASNSNIIKLSNMVFSGRIDFRIFSEKKEVFFYSCEGKNLSNVLTRIIDSYLQTGNTLENGLQILIPMYAGVAGIDAVNKAIQEKYNFETEAIVRDNQIFKKGDKVLQLKNDPELKLMNGDIGIIKGITSINNQDILFIDFDGWMVKYPAKDLDNLRLAYAISIHKSQGSEYENVILPILPSYSMMLRKKIIYTAITRAKNKLIILGNMETLKEAISRLEPLRQTGLLNRLSDTVVHSEKILDSTIPFDTFGEYGMEDITPYSFME